ncbi:hypothetical protein HETIRDRAFT_445645 [Heterobasidion irregulare TC 32-1]|uniref:Uncharacterized protein n=1 Tax=Heterobasidion irregulare (strain TC 32-1) TaxID=747525 RepID=W4K094_HETIT|nr:uncharacterized protein HETIRDRAFT_445645 [Heterobasidion irregulare TC 32-1]ETW78526.1 hypothetical protein HETIRDRAFT_445645 [Heterobasidion irregulare TC 32-1]
MAGGTGARKSAMRTKCPARMAGGAGARTSARHPDPRRAHLGELLDTPEHPRLLHLVHPRTSKSSAAGVPALARGWQEGLPQARPKQAMCVLKKLLATNTVPMHSPPQKAAARYDPEPVLVDTLVSRTIPIRTTHIPALAHIWARQPSASLAGEGRPLAAHARTYN